MVRTTRVEGEMIKRGPWTAEEDDILMNFVKENGPKDWSSIRSKGLLPRTGKSCRLRWVNKLQPNLKKGCKFSAEEERMVLELQATIGNKWAAIATNLPGRTDNDVKNFWSTRQKRLARILRSSPQPNRILNKRGKSTVVDEASPPSLQDSRVSSSLMKPTSSLMCKICSCLSSENFNIGVSNMPPPPHFFTPYVVDFNMSQPPNIPPIGIQTNDLGKPSTSSYPNDLIIPFGQEDQNFGMQEQLGEQNFMEGFAYEEEFQLGNVAAAHQLHLGLSLDQLEATDQNFYGGGDINVADYKDNVTIPMPDNIFDDLSDEMLDNLDTTAPRPSSSS